MSKKSKLSKSLRVTPQFVQERMAETSTRYSDSSERIFSLRLNITSSLEALCVLYISTFFQYWQTDTIIRSIAHCAYINNYSGRWKLVQEILETQHLTTEKFIALYEQYNKSELYGNLLPLILKVEKRIKYKQINSPDRRPVVRPQRARGYRDKGSRRLPHEHHGIPDYKDRESEDRRSKVACNPLVVLEAKDYSLFEDSALTTSESEGGELNVHSI